LAPAGSISISPLVATGYSFRWSRSVSAPSKRRPPLYLSLPVVIGIAFALGAKLVSMQRAEIIADLTDRVEHRSASEAAAAVHQLGAMPNPPIAIIVSAATSADRRVADEARHAVGRVLRRSQQRVESGRRLKTVAKQLTELAKALADERHAFAAVDHPWLVSTTQRILRLANQIPPDHTPLLATHCDIILTAIPTSTMTTQTDIATASESPHSDLEPTSASTERGSIGHPDHVPPLEPSAETPLDATWHGEWTNPVFRTLPTTPANATPPGVDSAPASPSEFPDDGVPAEIEILERPLAESGVRSLLESWLSANHSDALRLENQLAKEHGFRRLSKPLVEKILSNRREVRVQLVDEILTAPGIDARPWLMVLADDPDVEVRFAAVTVMATSTDETLVEKAWQTAIRDRDPRIAALAAPLRDRRAATQRR
jgi:hypothetical protein